MHLPLPHHQMAFVVVAQSELHFGSLKRCGLFTRLPYGNTCPGQRGGDKREAGYTNSAEFAVCSRRQGFIFFIFPMTFLALALLFAFFPFFFFSPGIGSDQCRSAAFFSPSMTFSPLTGAPGLGLCRRMALACLLRREATGAGSSYSNISKSATRARRRPLRWRGSGHREHSWGLRAQYGRQAGRRAALLNSPGVLNESIVLHPLRCLQQGASQPSRHTATSALLSSPGGSC